MSQIISVRFTDQTAAYDNADNDNENRTQIGVDWYACGRRLRLTRLALGITEQEAADAHRRTLRTYRKYEAGCQQRGLGIVDFAQKYDVSLDWLICGEATRLGKHLSKLTDGKVAIIGSYKNAVQS